MSSEVFIVSGTLGAGKTALCALINARLGYALISGDALFEPLEKVKKLEWDERVKITWTNIINITNVYLERSLPVVIDFVVEEELDWLLKEIEPYSPKIKYCQLIADEKTLAARLKVREGDMQSLPRSLELLEIVKKKSSNRNYLLDTTGKEVPGVYESFVHDNRFWIKRE